MFSLISFSLFKRVVGSGSPCTIFPRHLGFSLSICVIVSLTIPVDVFVIHIRFSFRFMLWPSKKVGVPTVGVDCESEKWETTGIEPASLE